MSDRIKEIRSRLTYANVAATIAVFFALCGTSYAFIIDGGLVKDESLTGADVRNESLTGADVRDESLTGADVRNGSLSPADVGVEATLSAVVNADGALRSSTQQAESRRDSEGLYTVRFFRNLEGCTPVASISTPPPPAFIPKGEITVSPNFVNGSEVGVVTRDSAGTTADRPFTLMVAC